MLEDFRYTFDGVSNITRLEDRRSFRSPADPRNNSRTYRYDDLYRLVRVDYAHIGSNSGPDMSRHIDYLR